MSAALGHWGRSLVAVALFGLLVELLLPSRATEGYVRLIVGLVLVTAVVAPILGLARSVVRGGLSDLPGAAATSLASVLSAEARPQAGQPALVAAAFAAEVRQAAAARASTVPGVAQAEARVVVGRSAGTYGQVLSVALTVRPTARAGRHAARLAQSAQTAVAAVLGLPPGHVRVRVLRPSPGPAP